jgi:RNA polymerase sigma-70 factor (ECF subfamily)
MDDKKIIELFFARAEGAMDALAEKYGKGLFHMCRNLLGDSRDAEECVSDTYLALWNTIPPEKPEPLSAYLYRVGRNRALKKLRDRSAQKRSGYEVSLEEEMDFVPDRPFAFIVESEDGLPLFAGIVNEP